MAHIAPEQLSSMPAMKVIEYAMCALEREAHDVLRSLMLFRLPVEAWGGGRELLDNLRREAMHWLGQSKTEHQEILERRRKREEEIVTQLAALVDAGDEAGAADLERLYAAECSRMDAEEVEAIRAANTMTGDESTIKALKRYLEPK